MKWDKEKELLEQISDCHKRVEWLVQQIVCVFGECPPDKKPGTVCREEKGCINCWIAASGRAVKRVREDERI